MTIVLNLVAYLLILVGSGLVVFSVHAIRRATEMGEHVTWLAGMNGWQALIAGSACFVFAATFFYVARVQRFGRVRVP